MSIWGSFEHDPRDPRLAPLRAADKDRAVIADALASGYAEGRLTREEYDDRLDRLTTAKTLGDLPGLVADLIPATDVVTRSSTVPATMDGEQRQRALLSWQRERNAAVSSFAFVALVTWAIWAITMFGGFPWPVFPTLALGFPVLRMQLGKQTIIASKQESYRRRAEKAQRKAELADRPPAPPAAEGPDVS